VRRALLPLTALTLSAVLIGPATAAERLQRHVVAGQELSLAVPASWIAVESGLPQDLLDRISRQNPKLAPYIVQLGQSGSPMKFLALDPAIRGGFATNANVVVMPVPTGTTFAAYRASLVAGLRTIASGPVKQRVVTIGGVRALRVSYRLQITLGQTRTVQTLQYAFLRKGRSIVVTYTTLPGQSARYAKTFQRSAASIRFPR
jgi:hypothetical protein